MGEWLDAGRFVVQTRPGKHAARCVLDSFGLLCK